MTTVLAPTRRGLWTLAALLPGVLLQVAWLEPARQPLLAVALASALVVALVARRRADHDDHGAAFAAVLIALLAPPATPLPLLAAAVIVALVAGRSAWGGVGQSPFHPAMLALALLMLLPLTTPGAAMPTPDDRDWLLAGAWCAGAIVLLARRLQRWQAPVAFLLAIALCALAQRLGSPSATLSASLQPLTAAGTWLLAAFVVADPVCGATSARARLVYGAGAGLLAMALRGDSAPAAVIAPALLLMNVAAPALDRWLAPARSQPA